MKIELFANGLPHFNKNIKISMNFRFKWYPTQHLVTLQFMFNAKLVDFWNLLWEQVYIYFLNDYDKVLI